MVFDLLSGFFFCLGVLYFFFPRAIFAINDFVKKTLMDDMKVLLNRKKIALMYIVLSFILLTAKHAVLSYRKDSTSLLFQAYRNYYLGNYKKALLISQKILKNDPRHKMAQEIVELIKEKWKE